MLDALPGDKTSYSRWQEQVAGVAALIRGARRVAMQYSPMCAIPYVSLVDAGTIELVSQAGAQVVSSAELIQFFEARWTAAALDSHLEAGRLVDRIRRESFELIGERTRSAGDVQEFEVKRMILEKFAKCGLVTDHGPIVAANGNAANPHYEPSGQRSATIRRGDFVLLDMWAKLDREGATYYDITWTGFCGDTPSSEMTNVFAIVRDARDAAIQRVQDAISTGRPLRGFEVDDAARGHVARHGYSEYFTHRTGHSIGQDVHGNGANMDNLETHDDRRIIPWTCFSIEPGIYLTDFGVRSEVNVFVDKDAARVTGEVQRELVLI
jgi:Xaa-Pro aminopeptidase